ncbi:MAG TPA: hypothetical protein VLF94_07420 [Chlamydiales bacterium]|nr:hypothetical protein [Chlamydiales bacterium]
MPTVTTMPAAFAAMAMLASLMTASSTAFIVVSPIVVFVADIDSPIPTGPIPVAIIIVIIPRLIGLPLSAHPRKRTDTQ